MNVRSAARLAWTLCAAGLLLLSASLVLIFLGWSTALGGEWVPWEGQAIRSAGIVGALVLGGVVAARLPGNPYGWLWLGFGLALTVHQFAEAYAAYALVAQPGALPLPRTVGTVVAGTGWTVWISLIPLLLLLFPTGRPPTRRWGSLVWTVAVAGGLGLILTPLQPGRSGFAPIENPLGVGGSLGEWVESLSVLCALVVLGTIFAAALSLVFRFRRAAGVERQQIKWFASAAVVLVGETLGQFLYEPPGAWDALAEILPLTGLYAAVGVAILRYRLYDIDRIINRTLVYGALTATLAAVYLGSVVTLQYAFRALTGGGSQLVVVASTLAIAALFSPLRRGIQGFIDRRFYRRKYDARRTLEAFAAKLREEPDLGALGEGLLGAARETVQPAHASLWLRRTAGEEENGVWNKKKSDGGPRNALRNVGKTVGA